MLIKDIDESLASRFAKGCVIPAMPLALDSKRKHDARRQRALARYYIDAGAGGLAVGVHSTQFEIRDPKHGLFEPVLSMVSEEIDSWGAKRGKKLLKIAGVCGRTPQAIQEAIFALENGYHSCLLSLSALRGATEAELLAHCRHVSEIMPVIGFYLQSSVGGLELSHAFWREFATIPNVLGVKLAPFNRYKTLDAVRAICESGRHDISLYTGNDDNIVPDLLTEYKFQTPGGEKSVWMKGGLLGHWAVWTSKAVELLEEIQRVRLSPETPLSLLSRGVEITDVNAALFDPANAFAGCIPGIHEALRRQGLLEGTWCLNPEERLSPGQAEEIERVWKAYPHLNDDAFVSARLDEWLDS